MKRTIRRQELDDEIMTDKIRKRGKIPVDYSKNSTEDETISDYELNPGELFPDVK
jgi:hypothetical protein